MSIYESVGDMPCFADYGWIITYQKFKKLCFFFPFIDQFDDDWTKFVRETKEKVFNEFQHGRLSVWQITIFFYMSNSQHVSRNQRKKNHDCRLRGSKVMGHFTNMWITGPTIGDLNSTFWSPWGQGQLLIYKMWSNSITLLQWYALTSCLVTSQ